MSASLASRLQLKPAQSLTLLRTPPGLAESLAAEMSDLATDLNRDSLWEALTPTGWRPVRQIALDDTWSAIRFRPADEVGR